MTGQIPLPWGGRWTAEQLSRPGAMLANLLLLAALASVLAQVIWLLWPRTEPSSLPPVIATTPESTESAGAGLRPVAALHLFGNKESVQAAPAEPLDAPDTRLNLELRGVMATESGALARAIIATRGGDELIYKVGDSLPGGASLHAIHADRVILRRNGRLETLRLPKESSASLTAPVSAPVSGRGVVPAEGSLADSLSSYRQRLQSNPQELASLARIQPVMVQGQLKGYRLSPNKEPQLFNRLGLRSGDIVTEVNGISVSDSARVGELFRELSTAQRLSVGLERRGQPTTISINLGQ